MPTDKINHGKFAWMVGDGGPNGTVIWENISTGTLTDYANSVHLAAFYGLLVSDELWDGEQVHPVTITQRDTFEGFHVTVKIGEKEAECC